MPRQKQRARLWLRKERRDKATGKLVSSATWLILDEGEQYSTGCLPSEIASAEHKLAQHIAAKHKPKRARRDIEDIDIGDVLSIYDTDCRERQANKKRFDGRMTRLNEFWGQKTLAEVTGATCRAYAAERGNRGGARRDLEDLRAAINHHSKEGFHRGTVRVVLPPKGEPRDRWHTRDEIAQLLWTCWRYREQQTRHRGADKGLTLPTDKRPLRHLARFILIGVYTGTRAGAIATASPQRQEGRSFVDLERGIFYRRAQGAAITNKRQPPAPIPPRLIAHIRRWVVSDTRANGGEPPDCLVMFNGKPVLSVKTAFKSAIERAGLAPASPHSLRHTAATWLMQQGSPIWEAAGFLGMSEKTLRDTYGHHHEDFLQGAVDALNNGKSRKKAPAKVVSLTGRQRA